ncbi:MAG TPA: GTP cyclohydrolase FolE2 [Xanthomonadales bacterium]|nr:GTP cyclohydrolase FolE2 [Xanthomonadales bacterium]
MNLIVQMARAMPDIASDDVAALAGRLDWVGMSEIHAPVLIANEANERMAVPARVSAFVNLAQPEARGIHMSRLYLHVDRLLGSEPLGPGLLRRMLAEFLDSHAGLSDRACVRIAFDHLLRRRALASDHAGWKSYPIAVTARLEACPERSAEGAKSKGQLALDLEFSLEYSSTCPCSAALARQLIQERFARDFDESQPLDRADVLAWLGTEEGICATPHSQRSRAEVRVRLAPSFGRLPIAELIDRVEGALKTVVQTAVKREDEQAFALLNGQNLMFCEDAARRVHAALDSDERVVDFHAKVSHFESLHAHDAVAYISKASNPSKTGLEGRSEP